MSQIRCEFCHQYISADDYHVHRQQHLTLRPDGQLTDYATLPDDERVAGELWDVPQVYIHQRCGAATGMPEEIIRTYLKNPWFYLSDKTFCTGCGRHVRLRDCNWTETGEDLQTYTDRLRAAHPHQRPNLVVRFFAGLYDFLT